MHYLEVPDLRDISSVLRLPWPLRGDLSTPNISIFDLLNGKSEEEGNC